LRFIIDNSTSLEAWQKDILEVLRLTVEGIKDVDEIPTKLGLTVQEVREAEGFKLSKD
jgi:hypothetical protein